MEYAEQRMVQEAAKQAEASYASPSFVHPFPLSYPLFLPASLLFSSTANDLPRSSFFTPLNALLFGLVAYVGYTLTRSPAPPTLPPQEPPTVFRTFTPRTLIEYNGQDGKPIYLAIRGRVFDVSHKAHFYGPGGPYENFAGRDATRGLAMGSFDKEMLTEDLEGPLDDLEGLGEGEMESLAGWEGSFRENYPVIGKLVPVAEFEAEKK